MRTPEDAFRDMIKKGRRPDQIRAVAVARGDDKLRELAEKAMAAETAEVFG